MRYFLAAALVMGLSTHAYAQQPPAPELEAMGRMLGDATQREFVAMARAIVAERRAAAAEAKLAAPPPAKEAP